MKRLFIAAITMAFFAIAGHAQKFALVDMEYILKNIPQYEAETLYKNYQSDKVFLTDEQKQKKEEEIVAKEKEAAELQAKYFGPQGELYKKRQSLIEPIQDDIYEAIKKVSEERGYQVIFDRASSAGIIFASPRIDVSNEVLEKLGYSK